MKSSRAKKGDKKHATNELISEEILIFAHRLAGENIVKLKEKLSPATIKL
jgi:hypothetical protein